MSEIHLTIRSQFMASTDPKDKTGWATFYVGDVERKVFFADFMDYHVVSILLNEARQIGREEAASQVAARLAQFVKEIKG